MVENIVNDLQLYKHFLGMLFRSQAQYKVNVVVDICASFAVTSLEFVAVLIYFGQIPSMLGWNVGEVAMLYAIMSIGFGLAEMFGAGIDAFSDTIRLGEFDRILLRPVGSFMQVLGSDFRLRRLGRITQGGMTFVIALRLLPGLHWTAAKVVALLIGIASGSVMFMCVLVLGATLC
ncbi:MAG: hypothetical protein E6J22_19945 [Chloroflexi bacterium]|nr:MAG: hypothetical protein E6J22_19945 [Chloroflexota bacterium]